MFFTTQEKLTNNKNAKPYLLGYSGKNEKGLRNYYIVEDSRIFWVQSYNTPIINSDLQAVELKSLPEKITFNLKFL